MFIILLWNFLYGFLKQNPRLNPITIFSGGFFAASIVCLFYVREWNLDTFHFSTVILLGGGVSIFSLTCLWVNARFGMKYSIKMVGETDYNVKTPLLVLLFVIDVAVQYWYYIDTLSHSGSKNLGEALIELNIDTFKNEIIYEAPLFLRNLRLLFEAITYFMIVILANLLVDKQYKKVTFPILFAIAGFMGGFMSSSRSGSMNLLFFFAVAYTMIVAKKREQILRMTFKRILQYLFVCVLGISLFVKSTEWIGREIGDYGALYYLSFYCGAEIKNLDSFVNEPGKPSPAFGYYTFHNFYFSEDVKKRAEKLVEFRQEGDYVLGNVYTCFQNYYQDFGVVGSFVFVAIMAFIMQLLFLRALHSSDLCYKLYDYKIFLYGFMTTHLFMSFFSERFYNSFTTGTLKLMIEFAIFGYVFEKYFRIKKGKVYNYEKAIDNSNSDV